ncbi:MAG: IS1595 family transposase [Bacteroidota bacterium]|nr:IS1595 family transposase [Bacteroidota bacterium]
MKKNTIETTEQIKSLFISLKPDKRRELLKELYTQTEELVQSGQYAKACLHCKSEKVTKYGKHNGEQRYMCGNCKRTFKETTGTIIGKIRKKETFLKYQSVMLNDNYMPLKEMSEKFDISGPTAFAWRHKILTSLQKSLDKFEGEIEIDDLWFRYSQKGRKGLKYSKKRGESSHKGDNNYIVKLLTATNATQTDMKVAKIGRLSKADIQRTMGERFTKKTTLISDKHLSISAFANQNKIRHIRFKASEHTISDGKGVQLLNNIAERVDTFLNRKCKGVSTKYLQLYANWFKTKETNKKINSESMQKMILSQKHTWDLFTNIENVYERFIKNHSVRTYRYPVAQRIKALNWNQDVILSNAFI